MSNTPENPRPQAQKGDYSNQSNASKVGNNVRKDEPTAQKKTGGTEAASDNKSSFASKPSKAS